MLRPRPRPREGGGPVVLRRRAAGVGAAGGAGQRDRGLQQPEPEQGAARTGHGRSGDLVAAGVWGRGDDAEGTGPAGRAGADGCGLPPLSAGTAAGRRCTTGRTSGTPGESRPESRRGLECVCGGGNTVLRGHGAGGSPGRPP